MARTIVGYIDGRPQWSDSVPARGRLTSGGIGGTQIVGGYPVAYRVEPVARLPEPVRDRKGRVR